jgi:hypothetical protein
MTYKLIIKHVLNTSNNVFLPDFTYDNIDGIMRTIFSLYQNIEINAKNKFEFFNKYINCFPIKNNLETEFVNYFCKIQKTYNTLNKFIYNYKYKKAKIVVNTDMFLSELTVNTKNVICIFHNNSKYLFHINDIIKIINSALTNSHMFFSEPIQIKNPYDNIPFTKSNLYNIYLFIRYKTDYYPELFFKFFNSDFNLTIFKNKHENLLRERSIYNYVTNSSADIIYSEIKQMIKYFNDFCKNNHMRNRINIDKDFPRDRLFKIMRPYLLLYITGQFALVKSQQYASEYLLKKNLICFNNFNPLFGRKKYRFVLDQKNYLKRTIVGKIIEFDDRHIKFNTIEKYNNNFLIDHLQYDNFNYINQIITNGNVFYVNMIHSEDDIYEDDEDEEEDEEDEDEEDEEKDEEEEDEDEDEEEEDEDEDEDEEEEDEEKDEDNSIS